MKRSLFLFFTALPLISGPGFAQNPDLDDAQSAELPHAFDAGWQGQKTCAVLFEDETTRVARCSFPPGIGHEKHYHNPHFGYVLEGGTLLIKDSEGTRQVTTTAGGDWSTTSKSVHEALNIGDTTTSYLMVEPKVK